MLSATGTFHPLEVVYIYGIMISMEIKLVLTPDEQEAMDASIAEFPEDDALQLLGDAASRLRQSTEELDQLRAQVPTSGDQLDDDLTSRIDRVWKSQTALRGLTTDLERVTGVKVEDII